jgi:hypothetical protein
MPIQKKYRLSSYNEFNSVFFSEKVLFLQQYNMKKIFNIIFVLGNIEIMLNY